MLHLVSSYFSFTYDSSEYGIFTDFDGDLYRIMYIYSFFFFFFLDFYVCCLVVVFFRLVCLSFFDYLLLSDVGSRT